MASQRIRGGRESQRRGGHGARRSVHDAPTSPGAPPPGRLQATIESVGAELQRSVPAARSPLAAIDDRLMRRVAGRADLRAALFRLVDVAPACDDDGDIARHLAGYLADGDAAGGRALRLLAAASRREPTATAVGALGAAGVRHMAHRFIAGEDPRQAERVLRRLWAAGIASSVDLLGEATVTTAEADAYEQRCEAALRALAATYHGLEGRPLLDRDSSGALARANLSVKVSALTPLLDPAAPELAIDDAKPRLRALLRTARDLGAHLHIDSEAFDTTAAVNELAFELLAEDEFRAGPSAGVVVQAYLRDSPAITARLVEWARSSGRAVPLAVRLVKGAYWDHEVVEAAQVGWEPPVFTDKAASDRNFEALTGALLRARPAVRVAVASHNLRSIAHAVALNRALGAGDEDLELQVLRGLGDGLAQALAACGLRARVYCPVGDLVAGMAYLVRRLLENTSNDSFLAAQAGGQPLTELLAAP